MSHSNLSQRAATRITKGVERKCRCTLRTWISAPDAKSDFANPLLASAAGGPAKTRPAKTAAVRQEVFARDNGVFNIKGLRKCGSHVLASRETTGTCREYPWACSHRFW